jgi:hypothetical protein
MKLWPLNLEKIMNYQFSSLFFVHAFRYLFDIWYIALPYQDIDKKKYEFGFDPLIFHEVMALGLKKYPKLSVFRTFFVRAFRYSFDI